MTTFPVAGRGLATRSGLLLDSLYVVAVLSAVLLGGLPQLALAVPVAGVLGLRALHRRRPAIRSGRGRTA